MRRLRSQGRAPVQASVSEGIMPDDMSLPEPSRNHSVQARFQMGNRFLVHAHEEFDKGDRLQAGNKAYGAVVQYLKVIADSRGWPHKSNRDLREVASQIAAESGDSRLATELGNVYFMGHENYYENSRTQREVRVAVRGATYAIPKLKEIAERPPGEFTIESENDLTRIRYLTRNQSHEMGDTSKVGFSLRHETPNDEGPDFTP